VQANPIQATPSGFFFPVKLGACPTSKDLEPFVLLQPYKQIFFQPSSEKTERRRIDQKTFCCRVGDGHVHYWKTIFVNYQRNSHAGVVANRFQEVDFALVEVNPHDAADKEIHSKDTGDTVTCKRTK